MRGSGYAHDVLTFRTTVEDRLSMRAPMVAWASRSRWRSSYRGRKFCRGGPKAVRTGRSWGGSRPACPGAAEGAQRKKACLWDQKNGMLECLMREPEPVQSREEFPDAVRGPNSYVDSRMATASGRPLEKAAAAG